MIKTCKTHGETEYVLEGRGYHRCKQCRVDAVMKRRRKVKIQLVEHFGGACQSCGYDTYVGALDFHHVDEESKDFGLATKGVTISFERMLTEAEKCVLVCANCHREIHAGIRECPPLKS